MIKVVTALGNHKLSENLEKEEQIEVIEKDIQYQEGIIELLDKNINVDFFIIDENLKGAFSIKKIIEEIKQKNEKIKIILLLEKKDDQKNICEKNIHKIVYDENKNITIKKIINKIKEENVKKEKEKEEILEGKDKQKNIKLKNIIEKENILENKIISILGAGGVGKSVISINIAKSLIENKNKILIIDFDILNNSLHTILGVKQYPQKIRNKIKNNYLNNLKKI